VSEVAIRAGWFRRSEAAIDPKICARAVSASPTCHDTKAENGVRAAGASARRRLTSACFRPPVPARHYSQA
jgi:hypothetical protein